MSGRFVPLPASVPPAGCTVCHTETAVQVRAGIADDRLAVNVLATVLPFVVVAGVAALIHFGPAGREGRRGG